MKEFGFVLKMRSNDFEEKKKKKIDTDIKSDNSGWR